MTAAKTSESAAYFQPAEWATHRACWVAWPSHADLWLEALPDVQEEFTALCRAIAAPPASSKSARPRERLEVLTLDASSRTAAEAALGDLPARFHPIPFGDIWLRDTAPIFLQSRTGSDLRAARFAFNGWGGKYRLPHDTEVASRVASASGHDGLAHSWILEGGSVEVDGEGTCLTTRQCLLNPNRNMGVSEHEMSDRLRGALGVEKVLWIDEGLLNDHTDGHIDTIARFVAPGVVTCMEPAGSDDPNRDVMNQIARSLESLTDAKGRRLDVVKIPSPGRVTDEDGKILPASYLNFYIGNHTVIVPIYGAANDSRAVDAIAKLFPDRATAGLPAKNILAGGGAFHCITQQEPA